MPQAGYVEFLPNAVFALELQRRAAAHIKTRTAATTSVQCFRAIQFLLTISIWQLQNSWSKRTCTKKNFRAFVTYRKLIDYYVAGNIVWIVRAKTGSCSTLLPYD